MDKMKLGGSLVGGPGPRTASASVTGAACRLQRRVRKSGPVTGAPGAPGRTNQKQPVPGCGKSPGRRHLCAATAVPFRVGVRLYGQQRRPQLLFANFGIEDEVTVTIYNRRPGDAAEPAVSREQP